MDGAQDALTACKACPMQSRCVFMSPSYSPGQCLHEYKLLHAFVASRIRQARPAAARDYARLAEEARRYAQWLSRVRPFDPSQDSNPLPMDTAATAAASPQSSLLAFGASASA